MAIRFLKSDMRAQPHIHALIMGPSKIGKTMLSATAPMPVLVLSLEHSYRSLSGFDQVDIVELDTVEDLREALSNLREGGTWDGHYKSVVIDSISAAATMLFRAKSECMKKIKSSTGSKGKAGFQFWPELNDEILSLVFDIKKVNADTFTIAQMTREIIAIAGEGCAVHLPLMPGKNGQKIPYDYEFVFTYRMVKGERVLQTCRDESYEGGDNSRRLSPYEWPDLEYLVEKINGVSATPRVYNAEIGKYVLAKTAVQEESEGRKEKETAPAENPGEVDEAFEEYEEIEDENIPF